ncbi:hypothetical protein OF83DRAFT_219518 [Amylostereum chailletii]|nr:hypothetical protein OF83DRAFT_219518 [Amylostereum chailletii]
MAFFAGTQQEVFEHRLRRTPSSERRRPRPRSRSAGAPSPAPVASASAPASTSLLASVDDDANLYPPQPSYLRPSSRSPTPPKAKTPSPSRPHPSSGPTHPFPSHSHSTDASSLPPHAIHPSGPRAAPESARGRGRNVSATSGGTSRLPLGSTSDGGSARYYPPSSSSSAHYVRPHISGNLSDAGTSSDRASSPLPGPTARIDVKRLLSKPAAPTYHRTSLISLSDSEFIPAAANRSRSPLPPQRAALPLPSPENTRAAWSRPLRETRSPVNPMPTPTSAPGRQMPFPTDAHTSPHASSTDRIASPAPPHPSPAPSRPSPPRPFSVSPPTASYTMPSKTSLPSAKESKTSLPSGKESKDSQSKDGSDKSKSRSLFRRKSRGTSSGGSPRGNINALAEVLAAKDAARRGHAKMNSDIPYDMSWGKRSPPRPAPKTLARDTPSTPSPAPSILREPMPVDPPKAKLTPANEIIQAYKEQSERRENLAASARGDARPGSSAGASVLSALRMGSGTGERGRARTSPTPFATYARNVRTAPPDETETVGPYYTLFGSSTRVVSPGPDAGASPKWTRRATVSATGSSPPHPVSAPPTVRKALARKASGRLRRPRTAEQMFDGPPSHSPAPTPSTSTPTPSPTQPSSPTAAERPSLQERRSTSLPKEGRKSLRLSIDDFVRIEPPEFLYPGRAATLPTPTSSSPADSPVERKVRAKAKEEEGASRLWKLVKRLSTNGLRDKYQPPVSTPTTPPVPPIPKALLPLSTARELEVRAPTREMTVHSPPGSATGRFFDSRTSMSGVRPTTAPAASSAPPKRRLTGASKPGSSSQPTGGASVRPSTSTSSSDLASARFFHRASSPRSSASSLSDVPPVPDLGARILSPVELKRFDEDEEDGADERERPGIAVLFSNKMVPASIDESEGEHALRSPHALPLPPRRDRAPSDRPMPSPDMPVFSITDAVNTFASNRPSRSVSAARSTLSDFGQVDRERAASAGTGAGTGAGIPPPPRPARSPHRPSPTTSLHTSGSSSVSTVDSPTTDRVSSEPVTPTAASAPAYARSPSPSRTYVPAPQSSPSHRTPPYGSLARNRKRESQGTHSDASTARPLSPSGGAPAAGAALTFRELDSEPKALRTDQEKDRMWDDLMERSALAGGTLHLGEEQGLMSDRIRFSVSTMGTYE